MRICNESQPDNFTSSAEPSPLTPRRPRYSSFSPSRCSLSRPCDPGADTTTALTATLRYVRNTGVVVATKVTLTLYSYHNKYSRVVVLPLLWLRLKAVSARFAHWSIRSQRIAPHFTEVTPPPPPHPLGQ